MHKYCYIFILLLIIGTVACEKNVVEPHINHSSKYAPLEIGMKWTYQMDSISYSGFVGDKPDTLKYLIRNEIKESFVNNLGKEAFLIEKMYKLGPSFDWTFSRQYSESKADIELLRTEFDNTKVVLSFPLLTDKEWNGNQYSTGGEIDFYYESIHQNEMVGSFQYDSTTTVMQEESINAIQSFFLREKYAAGFGLVSQEYEHLQNLGMPTQKGSKYKLTLISFEK
ncbi:MAG: hypothetical protein HKP14_08405 [Bacteroidia bacterium]|nr:hypothetical protein [Bacteroidia bacterium]